MNSKSMNRNNCALTLGLCLGVIFTHATGYAADERKVAVGQDVGKPGQPAPCTITIYKKASALGTGFSFSSNWSGLQGITLDNGQSISKTVTCGSIYNVFETLKPGWALTNIACVFTSGTGNFNIIGATTGATNGFEPGDNEVSFSSVGPGASLQCTFINTAPRTICADPSHVPPYNNSSSLSNNVPVNQCYINDAGECLYNWRTPGTYTDAQGWNTGCPASIAGSNCCGWKGGTSGCPKGTTPVTVPGTTGTVIRLCCSGSGIAVSTGGQVSYNGQHFCCDPLKDKQKDAPTGVEKKLDQATPQLTKVKVLEVNDGAKTITVMPKDKMFTFDAKNLKSLPRPGEFIGMWGDPTGQPGQRVVCAVVECDMGWGSGPCIKCFDYQPL